MNSIITGLVNAGIPAGNIRRGTMTPNTAPAVNLNVTTTTTTTTNTTTNCPSGLGYSPPSTDIKQTWQQ